MGAWSTVLEMRVALLAVFGAWASRIHITAKSGGIIGGVHSGIRIRFSDWLGVFWWFICVSICCVLGGALDLVGPSRAGLLVL